MIHTAEDSYSHSNWVAMGQTTLIDPGVGFWNWTLALLPPIHDGATDRRRRRREQSL
jgi:hypothetical protein